uniref:Uncharacterized protein n=1 Tax=Arundo donax TaxID=35708 RepID=A0A0A9FAX6_ARUDO
MKSLQVNNTHLTVNCFCHVSWQKNRYMVY